MSDKAHYVTATIAAVGALGAVYYAYNAYIESRKSKLPEKWKQIGTLKNISVYPIKSCAPIILNEAECTILGLRDGWLRDRVLMVVDENYNFITGRVCPELLLVQPTFKSSILTLEHNVLEPLHIDLKEVSKLQKTKSAVVFGVTVPVYDCGDEAAEWYSKLLQRHNKKYRLVYYASQKSRKLTKTLTKFHNFTKNDTGALSDEVPYSLMNETSVEDLNRRLNACQITPSRFRPNLLITGPEAFEEDNWKYVKIGDNIFEILKPCGRCVLTTIDPETGNRHSEAEPLKTLKSYRQIPDPVERKATGNAPLLGLQMSLRSEPGDFLSLNDPVYIPE